MLETIVVVFLCVVVIAAGAVSWWMDNHSNTDQDNKTNK